MWKSTHCLGPKSLNSSLCFCIDENVLDFSIFSLLINPGSPIYFVFLTIRVRLLEPLNLSSPGPGSLFLCRLTQLPYLFCEAVTLLFVESDDIMFSSNSVHALSSQIFFFSCSSCVIFFCFHRNSSSCYTLFECFSSSSLFFMRRKTFKTILKN